MINMKPIYTESNLAHRSELSLLHRGTLRGKKDKKMTQDTECHEEQKEQHI